MQANNPWPGLILRLLMLAAAGMLFGVLIENLSLGLLLAALVFIGLQLHQLERLEGWLRRGELYPPQAEGVWGEVFDRLYHRQQRHRQRRQRLARLLSSFRESANAMPDAVVVLREHSELQWWNRAARDLLGLRWPQDEGQRIDNLFRHPDFKRFLDEDDTLEAVSLPSPLDPEVVLELRIVPYGAGLRLMLARDVTRLDRLERMRRDFVANISHELRTPLTVIHGLAETLAEEDDPLMARPLGLIRQQTERMRRLVDDLLLLSRLETDSSRRAHAPVDVPRLVKGLVDEARISAERAGLSLDYDVEEGWSMLGDEGELRSAFSNLIFNAIKYNQPGGGIHVSVGISGGAARFSVRDSGLGIPAHHIPRLTERFYRVDSARSNSAGGTGLGLAIVKHVLQRHQGELEIRSRAGVGSTFSCRFPAERVIALAG